ncbi:hypothetical protein LPJ61_001110 [Coemansia biformis]|uniref:DNA polymerase delta subunit 3 n=1 Tax=Coemansia biformis TaxID=1286918 RepID=A0A9W7YFH1_9FUNG|nr:hypothetical protein LPJ61_001110 [Coemansia biformis]
MDSASEVLSLLVAHESQVVTYRRVSRELKVHVNTAKQLLADYYSAHRDSCSATFLVSGTRRSGSGSSGALAGEVCVRLVSETELSAAQEEIEGARHHVYSVGPSMGVSRQALTMANVMAGSNREMAAQGAVGSSVCLVSGVDDQAAAPKPAPEAKPQLDIKPVVMHDETPPVDRPAASGGGKPAKSFFGRSLAGKKPVSRQSKEAVSDPPLPKHDLQVHLPEANRETTAKRESDEAADAARRRNIEDMFNDDSDFEETPDSAAMQGPPSEAVDSQADDSSHDAPDASDVEMRDVAGDGMDEDVDTNGDTNGDDSGIHRVRKRRKVTKVRHTKNARGMLVSEAVDVWESCSGSEAEPETAVHTTPAKQGADSSQAGNRRAAASGPRKPASKSKSAAPQRSILNFFGKK